MNAVATYRLDLSATIASVPSLLGFHPQESVVIVAMKDQMLLCTARTDIQPQAVKATAQALAEHGATSAIVVVYSDEPENLTSAAVAAVTAPVGATIGHTETGHVADGIYHSTNGTQMHLPADPTTLATHLVVEGNVVAADRDAFLDRVKPTTVNHELARELADLAYALTATQDHNRATEDAIHTYLVDASTLPPSVPVLAAWIVSLNTATVREPILARLAEGDAARAADRAIDLLSSAPRTQVVAAALAFTAAATWLGGSSPLAAAIAEQAHDADPSNVLAELVQGATGAGVPPSVFAEMLAAVTLPALRTPKAR